MSVKDRLTAFQRAFWDGGELSEDEWYRGLATRGMGIAVLIVGLIWIGVGLAIDSRLIVLLSTVMTLGSGVAVYLVSSKLTHIKPQSPCRLLAGPAHAAV